MMVPERQMAMKFLTYPTPQLLVVKAKEHERDRGEGGLDVDLDASSQGHEVHEDGGARGDEEEDEPRDLEHGDRALSAGEGQHARRREGRPSTASASLSPSWTRASSVMAFTWS